MPEFVTCGCGIRYDADTQSSVCPHSPNPVPANPNEALKAGSSIAPPDLGSTGNLSLPPLPVFHDPLTPAERKARESLRGIKVFPNSRLVGPQIAAVAVCMEALDRIAPAPIVPPAANATMPEPPLQSPAPPA